MIFQQEISILVVVICLTILVAVTILLETGHHFLHHKFHDDVTAKAIVDKTISELMVRVMMRLCDKRT